ncbi:hypothetical protein [Inquilinus sp. CA228]|uniref:hypothetical protein n=1 Tax=Inquilinus sp. CA228 TaxID=3455609 RepID=UPI003F8D13EE
MDKKDIPERLRGKIIEKTKPRDSDRDEKPRTINIGDVGQGATIIIGDGFALNLSQINISTSGFPDQTKRSGDCRGPASLLDALAPEIQLPPFKSRAAGSNQVARKPLRIKSPDDDDPPPPAPQPQRLRARPASSGLIRRDPAQIKASGRSQSRLRSRSRARSAGASSDVVIAPLPRWFSWRLPRPSDNLAANTPYWASSVPGNANVPAGGGW